MKRVLFIFLLVFLVLTSAAPALAQGPTPQGVGQAVSAWWQRERAGQQAADRRTQAWINQATRDAGAVGAGARWAINAPGRASRQLEVDPLGFARRVNRALGQ